MTKFFTITDDELTQLEQLKDVLLSCLNREYKDVCIINVDRIDMLRNYSLLSEIIRHIKFRADSPGITPEEWDYIKNADDQPYICPEVILNQLLTEHGEMTNDLFNHDRGTDKREKTNLVPCK